MSANSIWQGRARFRQGRGPRFRPQGRRAPDQSEAPKQDGGALDTARTVLEAANDFRDEATAAVCRRVIETSMNGEQPSLSDLRIINNYFQ